MKHACWLMLLMLTLLSASCTGRPRKAGTNDGERGLFGTFPKTAGKLVEIDLTGGVPEAVEAGFFPLPPERTYFGLVRALEQAADDERLSGALVLMGATEMGFARAQEVGRLLEKVRAKGVPVVCHAHQLSNSAVWLATAGCDRIWLSPAGGVDSVGLAGQVLYFRGALDRLKVRADFIAIGDYKSAVESFLRDGPSEQAREDLTKTFGSMRRSWIDGVKGARPGKRVEKSLETGPWSPKEAKARGLIDAVGYESDALADARGRSGAGEPKRAFGPSARSSELDIGEILRILSGTDEHGGGRPHIALVPAVGAIGMSAGGLFDGGGISEKALGNTLKRLTEEETVKAVVLRIDSPGGSALASDLLWKRLRGLREKKPLVVSVGSMAASGGYYMACAANEIVAERTSIVGSIGVFGGKLTFDEGLSEVGVNAVTFPASDAPGAATRAAYLSPFVQWDDATRQRVRASMKSVYDLFLERVALGRGMEIPKVHEIAQGKIWSGAQGKKNGLVDHLGGLELAIARARELGKLEQDAPVVLEGTGETLLELLAGGGEEASRAKVEAAVERLRARYLRFSALVPEPLRPFAGTLNPLMQGEHTLAALPFAIVVQ